MPASNVNNLRARLRSAALTSKGQPASNSPHAESGSKGLPKREAATTSTDTNVKDPLYG